MEYTYEDIAKMIDHALLPPTMTVAELESGIELALAYDVASVCIMPYYVPRCAELLNGSSVKASTVIGFPHGGQASEIKRAEAEKALADGCEELDMVVNVSQVLSEEWDYVRDDIRGVVEAAHGADQKMKVIFETCYLSDDQKIRLCEICSELKADWVKTSTGFGTGGATEDDIQLMRAKSASHVQVKASGGIRDFGTLLKMRELGATRIGASRTKEILDDCRKSLDLAPIKIADVDAGSY